MGFLFFWGIKISHEPKLASYLIVTRNKSVGKQFEKNSLILSEFFSKYKEKLGEKSLLKL